jgi:hypothetical protein
MPIDVPTPDRSPILPTARGRIAPGARGVQAKSTPWRKPFQRQK